MRYTEANALRVNGMKEHLDAAGMIENALAVVVEELTVVDGPPTVSKADPEGYACQSCGYLLRQQRARKMHERAVYCLANTVRQRRGKAGSGYPCFI